MKKRISSRIRFSVMTLAIGGILGLLGAILRGPAPLPLVDADGWAQAVTSGSYLAAQILTILGYVLPFFGFWGLYAYLSKVKKADRPAFWGFMLSIIGTSLAMPTLGVFSFVSPLLANRYLEGDTGVAEIISTVATGQAALVNLSGGTLYLLGTVLLGVAVWRGGQLSRWVGVFLALHGLLLVFGFSFFPALLLSWALIIAAGIWAFSAMRAQT